jgi:hypothetical protein
MNISKLANGFFEEAEATKEVGGAAKWAVDRYKNKHKGCGSAAKCQSHLTRLYFLEML